MPLFVSSFLSNSVLTYQSDTGVFNGEFVTPGLGGLNGPRGLTFDSMGRLYVSSFNANNVLRYNADGSFDRIFATGNGLMGPTGLTFGSDSKLYVANNQGTPSNVLRFNADGTFDVIFAANAQLEFAGDLLFSGGKLYVTSGKDLGQVVRFNADGTFDRIFANVWTALCRGLAFALDGSLLVSTGNNVVNRYDGASGAFIELFATANGMTTPGGLAIRGQNLHVACGTASIDIPSANSSVLQYDIASGEFRKVFASGGGLNWATFLTFRD